MIIEHVFISYNIHLSNIMYSHFLFMVYKIAKKFLKYNIFDQIIKFTLLTFFYIYHSFIFINHNLTI